MVTIPTRVGVAWYGLWRAMLLSSYAMGHRRGWPLGSIEELPSGALRVRVYACADPVTGRRHDLTETIPARPKAGVQSE